MTDDVTPRRARRVPLRILGWNIGLLFAGLILAELVFGNWIFGPGLGLLGVPRDVEIRQTLNYLPDKPVATYTRDSFGLRGRYEDPADIDLLAVGGSTTNELYVGDGETFTDRLAARFRADGVPLTIANAGVDGHSTVGHLKAFDYWFPRIPGLTPKWVLFYIGVNDPHIEHHLRYDSGIVDSGSPARRVARWIRNNSALYRAYRIAKGALAARRMRVVHGTDAPQDFPHSLDAAGRARLRTELAEKHAERVAAYGTRARKLAALTRDWGATPIFVTQTRFDALWDGETLRGANRAAFGEKILLMFYGAETMRACRDADGICIDLGRELAFAPGDFYDLYHTTPRGSDRIAGFLYRRLAGRVTPKNRR